MSESAVSNGDTNYHLLIDNIVSGFAYHKIIYNSEGKPVDYTFLTVNKAFEKLTGLRKIDILGKRVTEVYPGIERMEFDWIGVYGKVAITGEPITFEQYFESHQHWYGISAYCPQKNFFAVSVENITARKKAEAVLRKCESQLHLITDLKKTEKALQESEKKYRSLFDHSENGIFIYAPETMMILDANPAMTAIYGYSHEELVGMNCLELSSELAESVKASEAITNSGKCNVEIRWHKKKDSSVFPIELDAFAVELNGRLVAYTIVKDLTERKQAAEEKEKLKSQVQQAMKMQAVGTLAAGIAHEINTPTQFISANIDFMDEATKDFCSLISQIQKISVNAPHEIGLKIQTALEGVDWDYLAAEMPQAISQSQEGIKRITTIVQAMKDFSHPGSKEKISYNLNQIIETTVTVSRNEWKYAAEIDLDLGPDLPKIPLLVEEMGQVFLNILINAAHAIEAGLSDPQGDKQGKIKISSRQDEEWIEVRISDNGTGMPDSVKKNVFDPFFTTKAVGKGTGQGLAMAYNIIVDKHHGTINCESEEGVGTIFVLRLPITA